MSLAEIASSISDEPFPRCLDASSDAALFLPAFGAVVQRGEGAQLRRGVHRPPDAQRIGGFLGHGLENGVAAKAE